MSPSVKSFPFWRRYNIFLLAFRMDIHGYKVPSNYNRKLFQMFYKYFALNEWFIGNFIFLVRPFMFIFNPRRNKNGLTTWEQLI
jgi:hypothetical protein